MALISNSLPEVEEIRSDLNTKPMEGVYSVPIRRTRWSRFWIGVAANVVSLLLVVAYEIDPGYNYQGY